MKLRINGKNYDINEDKDTPLLWVLRENLGLRGTKFGCGIGVCGACSVVVNDQVVRSCITPIGQVEGKSVLTIECIDKNHPVKKSVDDGTSSAVRLLPTRSDCCSL